MSKARSPSTEWDSDAVAFQAWLFNVNNEAIRSKVDSLFQKRSRCRPKQDEEHRIRQRQSLVKDAVQQRSSDCKDLASHVAIDEV